MTDLEDLVQRLQALVNKASQVLGPTENLNPILAVVSDGTVKYRVLDPALFAPGRRDILYNTALPTLIKNIEPEYVAMVVMLNYYSVDDLSSDEKWDDFKRALTGKLTHPETVEGVLIAAYSRSEESLWVSEIERFEDEPPLLSVWTELPQRIYSETIEALRRAMLEQSED